MSTKLFENLNSVKSRVVDYMYTINENINWLDFFNKYGTLSDHKILRRIKSLVWIDKTMEYENSTNTTVAYFNHYISLLMKFRPVLDHNPLYIIPPQNAGNEGLIDEFEIDLAIRFSIVKRLMTLFRLRYVVLDLGTQGGSQSDPQAASSESKGHQYRSAEESQTVNPSDIKVLLPLGSITYPEEALKPFENISGVIIPEGYSNICIRPEDEVFNNIVLNVKAIMMSPNDVSEVAKTDYTMFHIPRP